MRNKVNAQAILTGNRPRKRVAILISGRGSNMAALIEAAKDESYPADIVLVMSNRPDAAGLLTASAAGIATVLIDHMVFGRDREAFERAIQAALEAHRIEIVCLAGFMRLLTPWFVNRWSGRLLNIHPSLLPYHPGANAYRQAFAGVPGITLMPEADYGFKLTPPQMSFAEQMVHLSQAFDEYLSPFFGQKPNPGKPISINKKDVIAFVRKSFDSSIEKVSKLTPAQLSKTYNSGEGTMSGLELLMAMLDHTTHHRASAEMYIRAKGITPVEYQF
jgi:uncharacterized damage-inducible protein DinB